MNCLVKDASLLWSFKSRPDGQIRRLSVTEQKRRMICSNFLQRIIHVLALGHSVTMFHCFMRFLIF